MLKKIINILIGVYIFLFSGKFIYSQATSYCIEQSMQQYDGIVCAAPISYGVTANYMGCDVEVLMNVTNCKYKDPNCYDSIPLTFYNISSVDWDFDACPNLTAYLFPGYPDNWGTINDYGLKQMMRSIDEQVATALFVDFYSSLEDKTQYKCIGTPPNCEFPNSNCSPFNVIVTNPKCEQLCLAMKNPGTSRPRFYIGFTPCDDNNQSCCITEFKMCMCGDEVKQTETTWPSTFICEGALPPSTGCFIPIDYTPIFNFPFCIAICE